jgi:hypothetical protein
MARNPFGLITIFLMALLALFQPTDAYSCMGGRGACVASCQVQNCATGYCTPAGAPLSQQTCVCSRCGIGKPPYP